MSDSEPSTHRLLDARAVLDITDRLHRLRDRVDRADVSDGQRQRWHSRLAAISSGAADDLERAEAQLHRLVVDLERHDV